MEISKEGKKYLNRCCRTDLLRVVTDFKVSRLYTDAEMAHELANAVGYFITSAVGSEKQAYTGVNAFIQTLVYVMNKLTNSPDGSIGAVQQIYHDFKNRN